MRSGEPLIEVRQRREKSHDEIVRKCHPAIFELAALWKEHIQTLNGLGANPPAVAVLEARTEKRLAEIKRKYSDTAPSVPSAPATETIFSKAALTSKSDEQGIVEGLHWLRHRTPLWQDVQGMEARNGKAAHRVLQTGMEYEALRCDHGKPKPFKGDLEHFTLFQALWDFGIGNLTLNALADFLDDFCPCGKEHDPDALRKQRTRFEKVLSGAA